MKLTRIFLLLMVFSANLRIAAAQDTLPRFSVINKSGKVIVSWVNPFDTLIQISIQRSPDSLRGFKTILTIPDPNAETNGFLDNKAPNATQFYKIYVQQPGGKFFFTSVMKPSADTSRSTRIQMSALNQVGGRVNSNGSREDNTKAKPLDPKNMYTPSIFVYTNPDGNVVIALPDNKSKQYSIRFFRENGSPVFQMSKVAEPVLTLDKSNFLHAGWFNFELYENEVLKEKNKFFIPKDRN